ncbi:MAG: transcription termination factor NusA [Candidatus Krumholzibacteria bacterium]|jgi:N utilization substance protein A|nr:transcription termination factor NusA [Candidatus Krumholzibacteria bacterium]
MDHNVIQALQAITREKHLDQSIIVESLEAGLQSAAKKKLGAEVNVVATVDPQTGEMLVEQVKTVAAEVLDPDLEISLEEAQLEFGDEVEIGDEVRWELPLDQFGRNAILVAKQILVQKVREAERFQIYDEFKDKVNTIIEGKVQQLERGNALINLGRVEALLPHREQIRTEPLRQGAAVRAFIIEVLDSAKGPQIILSRSHPDFLKALFAQEVPEIQEGIVEIKAVAREPGTRSKIAVQSRDDRVDPIGSCVGMKGSRVQAVTHELKGERVDIVLWSPDPIQLISRALSPAEVNQVILNDIRGEATVVVTEDQLSKAIGKEGKNVRLAAKLTGWKIDLVSSREYGIRQRVAEEVSMRLDEMSDMTPELAATLRDAGIDTIRALARIDRAALAGLPGVGDATAEQLQETAEATLAELERVIEATVQEELSKELGDGLIDESKLDAGVAEAEATLPADAAMPADPFSGFEQKVSGEDEDEAEDAADAADAADDEPAAAPDAGDRDADASSPQRTED